MGRKQSVRNTKCVEEEEEEGGEARGGGGESAFKRMNVGELNP